MEGINKKYNLEIEVLTPLSIGAGQEKDWARGVDFVVDNGKLYKLNLKKMVANGVNVDDLTSYFALKNEAGLKSKLAGKLDLVSDFSIPFPVESDYDVKAFVKNQLTGNPVLPGSSLKGSVRSVLLDYLATKEEINNAVSEASRRRRPFESFIFGSSNTGDEFMRFIKITDAEFDRTEWFPYESMLSTTITNSVYVRFDNSINIYAGILEDPALVCPDDVYNRSNSPETAPDKVTNPAMALESQSLHVLQARNTVDYMVALALICYQLGDDIFPLLFAQC